MYKTLDSIPSIKKKNPFNCFLDGNSCANINFNMLNQKIKKLINESLKWAVFLETILLCYIIYYRNAPIIYTMLIYLLLYRMAKSCLPFFLFSFLLLLPSLHFISPSPSPLFEPGYHSVNQAGLELTWLLLFFFFSYFSWGCFQELFFPFEFNIIMFNFLRGRLLFKVLIQSFLVIYVTAYLGHLQNRSKYTLPEITIYFSLFPSEFLNGYLCRPKGNVRREKKFQGSKG